MSATVLLTQGIQALFEQGLAVTRPHAQGLHALPLRSAPRIAYGGVGSATRTWGLLADGGPGSATYMRGPGPPMTMPRGESRATAGLFWSTGSGNSRLNGSWLGSRLPASTDAGIWKASTLALYLRAQCDPVLSGLQRAWSWMQAVCCLCVTGLGSHGVLPFWLTT